MPALWTESANLDVRIDKGEWIDPARGGRAVPYKIYRPEILSDASYPVVIWSHGLGGTRDGAGFIGRHLAAQGYIHIHIQHDGTDDSLWRGMPGHPWDNIRKATIPWETVRNRYLDVHYALKSLDVMNAQDPFYKGKLDMGRMGMSGHSFGALTTQIMAGQPAGRGTYEDLSSDRFVSGILYSPIPTFAHQTGGADNYKHIKIPLLHMTGTHDQSPVENFGYERRIEVFSGAGHDTQHMFVINGGDHMVYNGSRGQLPSHGDIDRHQELIAIIAHAWWDATLKGDRFAYEWLYGDDAQNWLGSDGIYKRR